MVLTYQFLNEFNQFRMQLVCVNWTHLSIALATETNPFRQDEKNNEKLYKTELKVQVVRRNNLLPSFGM